MKTLRLIVKPVKALEESGIMGELAFMAQSLSAGYKIVEK